MYFTYLRRELQRRSRQAVVVAIGLAIGIALVLIISSASAGVKSAQGQVLHSLYGVGTDMTVTEAPAVGAGGPERFGGAGTQVSGNALRPTSGEAPLPAGDVSKVASLHGVSAATGGLTLTDLTFSGTIPSFPTGSSFPSRSSGTASSGAGSSFSINSFTVDAVQISSSGVGPLSPSEITKGAYFATSQNDALVAIVSSSYATQASLDVGSTIDVAGKALSVIGIASTPSSATEVFIPLGTGQTLAGLKNEVTIIYVSVSSASEVGSVASAVAKAVPKATVTTSSSLASEVSGSLSSAANLATNLGKWLSAAALVVAFLVAGLLMMAAVSRRVQEFGTLKALGWRTRRIVGQVMGEGITLGIVGGVAGILLGIGGAGIITAISPSLKATVGSSFATGGGGFGGGGSGAPSAPASTFFGAGPRATAARTVLVHLGAPLQSGTIELAVVLAIAGGLLAGAFGSWRAARLRPAAAFRRVG